MGFALRPYQLLARDATISAIKEGHKRVANILPTGAGKTEIMAATLEEYLRIYNDASVLVLSHLSDLTGANSQTFKRFKLRTPNLSIGVLQGKHRPSMMNQVVISTMQTARMAKRIQEVKAVLLKPIKLIIVDETHMLPTNSYETIQKFFPDAQLIGYTATPFREKKLMTNYFDRIAFSISLQELIDQGYLVKPQVIETCIDQAQEENAHIMNVVSLYLAHERGKKAIVYMRTIDDAKLMRNAFEELGVRCRAVTSDVPSEARREIYDLFQKSDTDVLVTVDVLTAGFDAPIIEAIFMPYGTKSPTQYLQRIGRGLRTYEGKTTCRIYMFGDAPTVSNKMYEKMNTLVMNAGRSSPGAQATYRDELDYTFMSKGSEIYHWTKGVVDLINRMEKLGMQNFAKLLNEKKFPKHFMISIDELILRLPKNKRNKPHGEKPATDAQKTVLFEAGFGSEALANITKNEASMMIGAVFNKQNDPSGRAREFIVPEGMYKGRHISEVPHKYRNIIKKQFPGSKTAELLTAWESRKRRA